MAKGNINVSVENIFPLIKKFLYSDHEIFLRELVSNATDATLKLKHLTNIGEAKTEYGSPVIEIKINKENKTLHVLDSGIGMTEEEVIKYINEVAFSGAEDFISKHKDAEKEGIIGHFGLGFYSSFMVADKVEIITKSDTHAPAVHWVCDGSPEFELSPSARTERGTEIILHLSEDSQEFLEDYKIRELLLKYNRFMPIPIKFGTKEETLPLPEGADKDAKPEVVTVDDIINNPNPAWTKTPTELKDEDYKAFYHELYPMQFDEPLFYIHLNVDYPFHLTGILFFPKIGNNLNLDKDKIQLYQNQVFVTDEVKGIVPDFLMLLRGVIDSPDIPLNVSRSYLQADGAVKKISSYITKKVADKMVSLMNENREEYEKKWNDIKLVIEYGMISEEKFYEKSDKFALYPTVDGKYCTFDELKGKIKDLQTDKDGNLVILYATNVNEQDPYIQTAKDKGYEVLLLDSPLVPHWIQKLETTKEKISFVRVDADHINNLIKKDESTVSVLSDEQKETLKKALEESIDSKTYTIELENLGRDDVPFMLTQPEFMRRMKDMQQTGGGMFQMGNFPEMYNLVVNTNNPLASEILAKENPEEKSKIIKQALDLAKLSQNILKGKDLTDFIKRSFEMIK
ncbi:MAG: molecular chaperone HtpG [Flavobacteriaceae bacterium]|jgi:molecular chaperone HtpG|nr:molecular chaperone HtpG [Flavobacteriaceae bacterium]